MNRLYVILFVYIASFLHAHDHEQVMNKLYSCSRKYVMQHDNNLLTIALGHQTRASQVSTIVEPGLYEFAGNISLPLTVASNNVTLDLNGYTAFGGIIVAAGNQNVVIKNGTVNVANTEVNAIDIQAGCETITLQNLVVCNATGSGVNCDTVRDSIIQNCDLTSNSAGLALDTCANIIVQNCNAVKNRISGFGMVTSTTCSFIGCSAFSTGYGNTTVSNNTVIGFSSNNGYGNLFDHCCANGTQALLTTDSNSLVAGFALRGSEGCSSIINCQAENTQTRDTGYTIPYGILLEPQALANPLVQVDSMSINVDAPNRNFEWSPDGNYIIASSLSDAEIRLYQFDRNTETATLLDTKPVAANSGFAWSPDGAYVAAARNNSGLVIYKLDLNAETLSVVAEQNDGDSYQVCSWSSKRDYIALRVFRSPTNYLEVYQFDRIAESLSFKDSIVVTASFFGIEWSPDSSQIAIAEDDVLYNFQLDTLTLADTTPSPLSNPRCITWSADGKYIAVTEQTPTTGKLKIFTFNASGDLVSAFTSENINNCDWASWSADGVYIVVTGFTNIFRVYKFDKSTPALTQVSNITGLTQLRGVEWSPDGGYIALADQDSDIIRIYRAFVFPSENVIQNNSVYCNSGGTIPSGIGISGSSIANLMINNTAYANPINPFMVVTNYAFVTNIFLPEFAPEPSILQNLSFTNNVAITPPPDLPLLWTTAFNKCVDIQSKTDTLSGLIP